MPTAYQSSPVSDNISDNVDKPVLFVIALYHKQNKGAWQKTISREDWVTVGTVC